MSKIKEFFLSVGQWVRAFFSEREVYIAHLRNAQSIAANSLDKCKALNAIIFDRNDQIERLKCRLKSEANDYNANLQKFEAEIKSMRDFITLQQTERELIMAAITGNTDVVANFARFEVLRRREELRG